MTARRGSDTLFATSYVRDSLSRITELTERVNGVTAVQAFTYDAAGRLATVTRNGTLAATYTYDLNGNRATKVTSGGTATAVVDDQDRLTSYGGATYAYTAHGDLSRKIVGTDTTFYTYDALGNLTQVRQPDGTRIGYLIDAQNRRIGKTVNDTLVRAWLYQGQLTPVAELDGSGTVVSRFVYATGVNVPDYLVRGDSTYRLIRDHLGSVRLVVNVASGAIAQQVTYDEFGIETANTNPGWQPFGYAGGLTDAQTGLVRFGARDYNPTAGRWTAKDPIGFAGGATSLYEYAANDPIDAKDITGRVVVFVHGTWSSNETWSPGFVDEVLRHFGQRNSSFFEWSPAGLSASSRRQGATRLAAHLETLRAALPCDEPIIIVAHSHGGNVTLMASQMTEAPIDMLVTLGTPITSESVPGAAVRWWTNVYSTQDRVQNFMPWYHRTSAFADNVRVNVNVTGNVHSDLHTPEAWRMAFGSPQ